MNRKRIILVGIVLLGLASVGIFAYFGLYLGPCVDCDSHRHVRISPYEKEIQQVNDKYVISAHPIGSGKYDLSISSVEIVLVNSNCEVMKSMNFSSFDTVGEMNEQPPQEVTVTSPPSYIVPYIPEENPKDEILYHVEGHKRTSDTPVNGSYEWIIFELSDPDKTSWCPVKSNTSTGLV